MIEICCYIIKQQRLEVRTGFLKSATHRYHGIWCRHLQHAQPVQPVQSIELLLTMNLELAAEALVDLASTLQEAPKRKNGSNDESNAKRCKIYREKDKADMQELRKQVALVKPLQERVRELEDQNQDQRFQLDGNIFISPPVEKKRIFPPFVIVNSNYCSTSLPFPFLPSLISPSILYSLIHPSSNPLPLSSPQQRVLLPSLYRSMSVKCVLLLFLPFAVYTPAIVIR